MPTQTMTEPHDCKASNAPRFLKWIKERGGIAVWRSADLSDPGKSWSTPATIRRGDCQEPLAPSESADTIIPYPKPTWQCHSEPERIITSTDDVRVNHDREIKRFRVSIRRGMQGLSFKCSDKSSARIRREIERAGKGAYYEFDYDMQEAVIYAPEKCETLTQWAASNPTV